MRSSDSWSQIDASASHLCLSRPQTATRILFRLAYYADHASFRRVLNHQTSGSINTYLFSQANTLRLYLTCIRNTLEAAMCLQVPDVPCTMLLLLHWIHQRRNLGGVCFCFAARIFLAKKLRGTTSQRWSSSKSCCNQEFSVILFCHVPHICLVKLLPRSSWRNGIQCVKLLPVSCTHVTLETLLLSHSNTCLFLFNFGAFLGSGAL